MNTTSERAQRIAMQILRGEEIAAAVASIQGRNPATVDFAQVEGLLVTIIYQVSRISWALQIIDPDSQCLISLDNTMADLYRARVLLAEIRKHGNFPRKPPVGTSTCVERGSTLLRVLPSAPKVQR